MIRRKSIFEIFVILVVLILDELDPSERKILVDFKLLVSIFRDE